MENEKFGERPDELVDAEIDEELLEKSEEE